PSPEPEPAEAEAEPASAEAAPAAPAPAVGIPLLSALAVAGAAGTVCAAWMVPPSVVSGPASRPQAASESAAAMDATRIIGRVMCILLVSADAPRHAAAPARPAGHGCGRSWPARRCRPGACRG